MSFFDDNDDFSLHYTSTMSSPTPPTTSTTANTEGKAGDALADCLMSQYRMTAGSIGLGTAYSLKYKKGVIPMIAAGAVGTTADLVYGYLVECVQYRASNNNDNESNESENDN